MNETVYSYYASVTERSVEWLWYPYIPYGKITLVEGDPGEGKSTFILNIASLLTKGEDMPDGYKINRPETVIYQCSEDDIADTIKPRLKAFGADCNRIAYILDEKNSLNFEDSRIEETLAATKAKLFILDPLQSYLVQDSDMLSAGRMRMTLGKLSVIAAKYKCAFVLVGHMNKRSNNKNLYRGLGSIDIAAIARSVLMVTRDSNNPLIRYMIPIKSSLSAEGSPISFSLEDGFHWIGPCEAVIDEEYGCVRCSETKRNNASDELISLLSSGPVTSTKIINHFLKLGISKRTLDAAKKELGIISYKIKDTWYWKLEDES